MPKYKIIYDSIKNRIINGEYNKNNNQLPDEISLCKEFNCSRMTMKKALDLLVLEGIIFRKAGHGTFIMEIPSKNKINALDNDLTGFSKTVTGKASSKIIDFNIIFCPKEIASKLNIKENDPVYKIIRIRYIDNNPFVYEKTFMPTSIIDGLNMDILEGSIYKYIEEILKLPISSAKKILRADKSSELDYSYLDLSKDEPVLEVEQIAYLKNGKAFEYSISRHRYDKFEFTSFSVKH